MHDSAIIATGSLSSLHLKILLLPSVCIKTLQPGKQICAQSFTLLPMELLGLVEEREQRSSYPGIASSDGGQRNEPGDEDETSEIDFVNQGMADCVESAAEQVRLKNVAILTIYTFHQEQPNTVQNNKML